MPKNIPEALRCFNAVSSYEYVAQIGLARIYARGDGVAVNREAAVEWYKLVIAGFPPNIEVDEDMKEALDYIAANETKSNGTAYL